MDPQHPNSRGERGLEALTSAQAAHTLGIAYGTVKSRTYYALRALRLAIEELRDVE